jgi:porphobilinogen deaminase
VSEVERIELLIPAQEGDGVRAAALRFLESGQPGFEFVAKESLDYSTLVSLLKSGNADLAAVSASWWYQNRDNGLFPALLLPRKEPTQVLISEDKPDYLPRKAIIVTDSELLRRQMLRARPDLVIKTTKDFEIEAEDDIETTCILEDMRINGIINGYIIGRSLHEVLPFRSRRHTLGIQRGKPERAHFIPPPLEGITIFLARKGFPETTFDELNDGGTAVALRLEMAALDAIEKSLHPIVGMVIEQKKVSTFLKEAEKNDDATVLESLKNAEGKLKKSGNRIEMIIELLNPDGKVTARAERLFDSKKAYTSMARVIEEWKTLLEIMTMEHEEDTRRGLSSSGAMMKID